MEHFQERLRIYYGDTLQDVEGVEIPTASVAKILLNNLALASQPQSIDQCNADLKSKMPIDNRDAVIALLRSLAKDHYLEVDEDGSYAFRFLMVQRWWIVAQGLNA